MQLLIIGANGGIGRNCVEQALEAGHQVTAIVRNPARLPLAHPNLKNKDSYRSTVEIAY
jgi:uncharacterized protein YbjT (DUF2867 family)